MLKFGGEKALTKHIHDEPLKCNLTVEDAKIEIEAKIIDSSLLIGNVPLPKPNSKLNARMGKAKVNVKKNRLEKAIEQLYDLEEGHMPEKALNVDFDLYQMEDY